MEAGGEENVAELVSIESGNENFLQFWCEQQEGVKMISFQLLMGCGLGKRFHCGVLDEWTLGDSE